MTYYQVSENFLKTMIFLEDGMNDFPNFDEITNEMRTLLQQKCAKFSDFSEILDKKKKKKKMQIQDNNRKIPKLSLRIIGFVYIKSMDFLVSDFSKKNFLSNKFSRMFFKAIF